MTRPHPTTCFSVTWALLRVLALLLCLSTPAFAEVDEDLQSLQMFYEAKDLIISVSRNPKPVSETAENITVITASEIEMMGAHTLLDVLNNIPGIQTDDRGSVGTFGAAFIQGALDFHTLYLLDGVRLNFLNTGGADIVNIPLQHIDRIEIVKGPGSSSWGSALGAVVNIVTKSPVTDRKGGGTISFSAGERGTRDTRGDASGTVGNLGYYLYAGNLTSNGFHPNMAADLNNLYGKLRWTLPREGSVTFTTAYTKSSSGGGEVDPFDVRIDGDQRYFLSTLGLDYPVNATTNVDLSLRRLTGKTTGTVSTPSTGAPSSTDIGREETTGGSGKVTWRWGSNALAAGADFDHGKVNSHGVLYAYDPETGLTPVYEVDPRFHTDRWGIFLNDTVTLGSLAISPGIRYDRTPQTGSFTSPSLGIAWNPAADTTVRAYAGRGFSLPVTTPDVVQEKVVTVQGGVETTRIPYLWLKTTLFYNSLRDIQGYDADWNIILKKQRKQGVEVEVKTVPVFNASLSAGYTFIDIKDRDTGERIMDKPRQIAKFGLHYDRPDILRASLLGRYVYWNASPANEAKDKAVICDLNVAKKVLNSDRSMVELFFTGHNIFNGSQYSAWYFPSARRWLEGGIRVEF